MIKACFKMSEIYAVYEQHTMTLQCLILRRQSHPPPPPETMLGRRMKGQKTFDAVFQLISPLSLHCSFSSVERCVIGESVDLQTVIGVPTFFGGIVAICRACTKMSLILGNLANSS